MQVPSLHCGADGLLLRWIDLRASLHVGLLIHPLVETRTLETPAIAQLEGGYESLRCVLIKCVG